MIDWVLEHEKVLIFFAVLSPASLILIATAAPLVIVRLPEDYFTHSRREKKRDISHPAIRLTIIITKNTLGFVFVIAGILMLFIPGQGLLTILIGIMLMDFPGKYLAERWIVKNTAVLKPLNWLREKNGKPHLKL